MIRAILGSSGDHSFIPDRSAMLSTFDANFQRRRDVEQFAIDNWRHNQSRGYGEAEYHCQGYNGEGIPPSDHVITCRYTNRNGKERSDFKLNGKRIAAHKIALRLGELGV